MLSYKRSELDKVSNAALLTALVRKWWGVRNSEVPAGRESATVLQSQKQHKRKCAATCGKNFKVGLETHSTFR